MKRIKLILLFVFAFTTMYGQVQLSDLNNKSEVSGTEKIPVSGSGNPSITGNLLKTFINSGLATATGTDTYSATTTELYALVKQPRIAIKFTNANTGGQNASLQIQNAYGDVTNSIFYNAPQGLRITTHDLLFDNNYVHSTGNIANQILSYYGNYASTNRLMVNPIVTSQVYSNSDFDSDGFTGAAFDVFDPDVTVTVTNCRFEGYTSLFLNSSGGSPTLIDGGGNTFVANGTIPKPAFINMDPTSFQSHGLLITRYHYVRHRGDRTP